MNALFKWISFGSSADQEKNMNFIFDLKKVTGHIRKEYKQKESGKIN